MSREKIKETIRRCDAYIEDLEKFRQALETVGELTELSPEGLAEWKESIRAASPDSDPLIEAMLNLIPGGDAQ